MTQLQRIAIAPSQLSQQQITLTADQQHYLGRVLRLRQGDRFIAMDGQGQWWLAELDQQGKAQVLEAIAVQTEVPIRMTLLVAMPKGNGMDDIVRQTTELGVSSIIPVVSDRTLLQPSPQKLERWQRIAQEAAEQSERQVVPEILSPQSWTAALLTWNATHSICYICEARGAHPHLLTCLDESCHAPHLSIVIATGAEGGWTEAEIAGAIASGYQPVSLGKRIFRAVTAPLVALTLVSAIAENRLTTS
jgi:16S rRNA (uracil1498-N3)-methyltransferase